MNMQYITNFSNSISKPFENKMIKKALHTSTVPLENVFPYYNILNSACQAKWTLVNNDFLVMEDYTCTSYE